MLLADRPCQISAPFRPPSYAGLAPPLALDCADFNDWLKDAQNGILRQYRPNDVFNCDETALSFIIQYGRSFVGPDEEAVGG